MKIPPQDAPRIWLQSFAGQTHKWHGTDTQQAFENACKDPVKKQKLENLGWLKADVDISYRFNKFGFRDDDFDDRPCAIALGCSYTHGVGLPEFNTWPRVLSNLLDVHVWNLGVGGSSLDTCYRALDFYINLKPKFVAVLAPSIHRFELCVTPNEFLSVMPWPGHKKNVKSPYDYKHIDDIIKPYFLSDKFFELNFTKTKRALKQLCYEYGIPCLILQVDRDFLRDSKARDLGHSGIDAQKDIANKFFKLAKDLNAIKNQRGQ